MSDTLLEKAQENPVGLLDMMDNFERILPGPTETERNTECTALCYREECIDCTKLCYKRLIRTESLRVALVSVLDRLCDNHTEIHCLALAVLDYADR